MRFQDICEMLKIGGFTLLRQDEHNVCTYTRTADMYIYKVKIAPESSEVYGFIYDARRGSSSYVCTTELLCRNSASWLMRKLREKLYDNCRYYDD